MILPHFHSNNLNNNMYLYNNLINFLNNKTQANLPQKKSEINNCNLRVLTLEIDRNISLEIWKTKNDKILNFGFLKCFRKHCLGLQKKIPSGTWVIEKRCPDQWYAPWVRWAVDSLIISYCIQGIDQSQKLYTGLECMVPKVMVKSS